MRGVLIFATISRKVIFIILAHFLLFNLTFAQGGNVQDFRIDSTLFGRLLVQWPDTASGGYFPIFVEFINSGDKERLVSIAVRTGLSGNKVERQDIPIKPGGKELIEMPAMAFHINVDSTASWASGNSEYYYSVEISSGSEVVRLRSNLSLDSGHPSARGVLFITASNTNALDYTKWSQALSWANLGKSTTKGSLGNVDVSTLNPALAPRRVENYTSLYAVVLDTSGALPAPEALNSMMAWARLGGIFIITGPGAKSLANREPQLSSWMEPRFNGRGDNTTQDYYDFGLGKLVVHSGADGLHDTNLQLIIKSLLQDQHSTVPRPGPTWADELVLKLPGTMSIPFVPSLLIIIIFTIVIGPVNFLLVRRFSRPTMLLITIPAISFIATFSLVAWSLVQQGLGVKAATFSITILDQRNAQASTLVEQSFFAGTLPGAGFRPQAGTILIPVGDLEMNNRQLLKGNPENAPYEWIMHEGLFSGHFLPSRQLTRQMMLTDQAARRRISLKRRGPRLTLQNGLDSRIVRIVVNDSSGQYYQSTMPIGPGESSDLVRTDAPEVSYPKIYLMTWKAPSTWRAQIDDPVFVDNCNISIQEKNSQHYVFGVLPIREEDWK